MEWMSNRRWPAVMHAPDGRDNGRVRAGVVVPSTQPSTVEWGEGGLWGLGDNKGWTMLNEWDVRDGLSLTVVEVEGWGWG